MGLLTENAQTELEYHTSTPWGRSGTVRRVS